MLLDIVGLFVSSFVVDGVPVLLSLVGSDVNEDGMGSSVVILVGT